MKISMYREKLRTIPDRDQFLLDESGLPGPRGNIELAKAVAAEGDEELFNRYLEYDESKAPTNTAEEFLAFCGVLGLGRLLSEGRIDLLPKIKNSASDSRWRTREAVAMALQSLGEKDIYLLIREMKEWSQGNLLEKRAAAATLCEPKLLKDSDVVIKVFEILDQIMGSILEIKDRKTDAFRALRKGLGYCWSVTVVANPQQGKAYFEKWLSCQDNDIRWILKENLKKARLARMDSGWVEKMKNQIT
jgi:hypothetical protein